MKCFFLTDEQRKAIDEVAEKQLEVQKARFPSDTSWEEMCKDPEVVKWCRPNRYGNGAMWYAPWYWDPANPEEDRRGKGILSTYYWRDWADKRPPICVIGPNGREWMPDQKSSNGEGWVVTGDAPNITAHPSINMPGYHGWLQNGVFSPPI